MVGCACALINEGGVCRVFFDGVCQSCVACVHACVYFSWHVCCEWLCVSSVCVVCVLIEVHVL